MFSPINKRLSPMLYVLSGLTGLFLTFYTPVRAQQANPAASDSVKALPRPAADLKPVAAKPSWFDKISIRGYVQFRYNRLLETNPDLKNPYDKSVGDNGGFLIRRARLVFSGNVHQRVYMYIQPDLAVTPDGGTSLHFAQIRDAYFDLALDDEKEFRFRVGQSKVPYGFENMQSSSNRLTLDRNDALNSAVPNERDLGVFFYWAPKHIRERFSELVSSGLKGSGDYGVFGLGIYNGQTTNRPEANDNVHVVARVSYPFRFKNGQQLEPGIQAYTGKYQLTKEQVSSTAVNTENFDDRRVGASFILYPKPFGLQAEYNVGRGPEFDKETQTIKEKKLHGGYVLGMYAIKINNNTVIPFVKTQYYKGGKKNETDARSSRIYETEAGVEWQPILNFELVAHYTISDRTTSDLKLQDSRHTGNYLRLQAQFNF